MLHLKLNRKVLAGATAVAVAAGAGGAYAATQGNGARQRTDPRQAFLNDAANRLHVTPAQLRGALLAALHDQLAAAVKAGRLTQAQANEIEQRIQQNGGLPPLPGGPLGGPGGPPPGPFGRHPGPGGPRGAGVIGAAAHYLGLTPAQLISQVTSGKSLAQIATSRGKTAGGLEQAILTEVRSRLARAVANGRITPAQEQRLLSKLTARLNQLINRSLPVPHPPGPPPHP
jgi:uncharacterized coiled-coil protein SlyX